jgi:hypothetical protein
MKYLDSGTRDPLHTLANWFDSTLNTEVVEFRLQTGFFSIESIGLLLPLLERCKRADLLTKILIGSNDAMTLRDDVLRLVDVVGIPRHGAALGVVNFAGAFFHPKTYHIKRSDGSEAAYVGSANLTASGLALHVEAGIALDTREGDGHNHLSEIASAIDSWFMGQRLGMNLIAGLENVNALVANGVLASVRPPRTQNAQGTQGGTPTRPRLTRLFNLPPMPGPVLQSPATVLGANPTAPALPAATANAPATAPAFLPSAPRTGFPPYLLFAPNPTASTNDFEALTGASLPGGSTGIIVRLNRDSARHFDGRAGTANISIPVSTVSSIRFGVSGVHDRPTAAFDLRLRYLSDTVSIDGGVPRTSVMGYGFTVNETGHGDIRMLVPASTRRLGALIAGAIQNAPTDGDLVLLEWPTAQEPSFGLSFMDQNSAVSNLARGAFDNAAGAGQLVGQGACWLAAGLAPPW